ncbi:MAG: hypothetical protein KKB90_02190 [Actinobacteria bacterium]|nr:hypothetical protein [Actinomycetota bacterium]MCG2819798.1 hypothetical protein [Actinomycetes bacterium]MBU4179185.1 hypothetical protein [Actinomycetota bacterium]MBU4217756.1 hypothetical protein [Actinomycetota bacterium]MBU4357987.1 hypothetical protein [Actinomycetota bacterium]
MVQWEVYDGGLDEFPWWWVALENVQLLVYWGVGFLGMYWLKAGAWPVASIVYAAFIVVVVGIALKKHNCSTCYYYGRWCHLGWGKLAAMMFARDAGNRDFGAKLSIAYPLIAFIPPLAMAVSLVIEFRTVVLVCLVVYLAWGMAQFAMRKRSCARCRIRYSCGGSAAGKAAE